MDYYLTVNKLKIKLFFDNVNNSDNDANVGYVCVKYDYIKLFNKVL